MTWLPMWLLFKVCTGQPDSEPREAFLTDRGYEASLLQLTMLTIF
jgi:hypothetical protein